MTIHEAIEEIRQFGTIGAENGKLKLRFPETERARLEPAIDILRSNRQFALETISGAGVIPPLERWPESLRELADERAVAARKEVWISWAEWKAQALNRLFREQGTLAQSGRIRVETIQHGETQVPGK
jgi:hypothetical protein